MSIDFVALGLPSEDVETEVKISVPTPSDPKSTEKVKIVYTRLFSLKVYGGKRDVGKSTEVSFPGDPSLLPKIDGFLRAFYATMSTDPENPGLAYDDWVRSLAVRVVNNTLMTRAKSAEEQARRKDPDAVISDTRSMISSGRMGLSEIEKLKALLAEAEAKLTPKPSTDGSSDADSSDDTEKNV